VLRWSRRWWQTDQFDWFSVYLRDRGLQLQWRIATFLFTLFLAAVPLVMLVSPSGPDGALTIGITVAASVSGFAASALWLVRWPTRAQSLAYCAVCCGCIAAGCLVVPNPYGGLMACTMFAAIGGFLAYFHAFAHVLTNFCVGMACALICATRWFAEERDIALVAGSLLLVLGLNVGVPFGIHLLVHSLRIDLKNSDHDPLTGLPNRRSFYNAVPKLTAAAQDSAGIHLNVTMVDLDNFKKLNDTRGHAVGDAALVSVAGVIQEHCDPAAVLGRLGGEEFVVADTDSATRHAVTVERIRKGIAAAPFQVTASFGTCSAVVAPGVPIAHPEFIDRLIRIADSAMYQSKRAGGDRIQHWYLDHVGSSDGR
jgi:diguanylate cyclase (GGDEF)-like protein